MNLRPTAIFIVAIAAAQIRQQSTTGSCSPVIYAEGTVTITYNGCVDQQQAAVLKRLLHIARQTVDHEKVVDAKLDELRADVAALNAAVNSEDVGGDLKWPVEVKAFVHGANYPIGTKVAGIEWRHEEFVDVRLDLLNRNAEAVEQLDFWIALDTSIAGIGQFSTVPDVNFFPYEGPAQILSLSDTDEQGKIRNTIPINPAGPTIAPAYRIYCPRLLPNARIGLAIASVALNPVINSKWPNRLLAPKRNPQFLQLNGSYVTREFGVSKRYRIPVSSLRLATASSPNRTQ